MKVDLTHLLSKWPSSIVARTDVDVATGGLLRRRHLANLDSLNQGPPRFRVGRKVCYRMEDLVSWLQERSEIIKKKEPVEEEPELEEVE